MHLTDRLNQVAGRHVLEQVPARAGLQRPLNIDIAFERGEHDDAGVPELHSDRAQGVDASQIRESEVHQRDVGLVLAVSLNGFVAARRLGYQQHIRLTVDDGGNPFPQ